MCCPVPVGKKCWTLFSKVIEYYQVAGLGGKKGKCVVQVKGGSSCCDQLVAGGGGRSVGLGTLKVQIIDRWIVRSKRKKNQG